MDHRCESAHVAGTTIYTIPVIAARTTRVNEDFTFWKMKLSFSSHIVCMRLVDNVTANKTRDIKFLNPTSVVRLPLRVKVTFRQSTTKRDCEPRKRSAACDLLKTALLKTGQQSAKN